MAADPDDDDTLRLWGDALVATGRAEEAVAMYRRALAIAPDNVYAHHNLATALASSGRIEEALRHYREAARHDPRRAAAHANAGVLLAQLGRSADAAQAYRQALRVDPRHVPALHGLAFLLAADPDPAARNAPEALLLARQACEWSRDADGLSLAALAFALAAAGRDRDAVEAAERALRLLPPASPTAVRLRDDLLPRLRRAVPSPPP